MPCCVYTDPCCPRLTYATLWLDLKFQQHFNQQDSPVPANAASVSCHCDNRSQAVSSHSMPGNTMPIRGEYKSQSTDPTPIAIASKSIARSTRCYNCISNWTVNSWTLFVPNPLRYYSVKNVVIGLTFIHPCCQSWLQCLACLAHICVGSQLQISYEMEGRLWKGGLGSCYAGLAGTPPLAMLCLVIDYLHGPHRCGLLCYNQVSC